MAVTETLREEACTVRTVTTAEEVLINIGEWQPGVLILDMALNGRRIMRQLRTPSVTASLQFVIGLVDRGDLRKLAAFDAGVDEILSVPFAPEEFRARVVALRRRPRRTPLPAAPVITVGQLEIDIVNRSAKVGGSALHLTPIELGLMYLLAANPGRVLTREEILDTLWGSNHRAEHNAVNQHVRNLRARLQTDSRLPRVIATVPGRGYRFLPAGVTG